MKKPLFIQKVDIDKWREYHKTNPAACLISEYDLGYRGLFGIQWGHWKFRFDIWWFGFRISHMWIETLFWKIKCIRFKTYREGKNLMIKDRLTGKKKEVGRFC